MVACAMYQRGPTDAELAASGLKRSDFDHEVVEVWPENWAAFCLFSDLQTQWRVGAGGVSGLDHNILFHRLDRMALPADEYDQLDADVRFMELEAMPVINAKD